MFQGIELIILILRYYPEGIGQTLERYSIYLTELSLQNSLHWSLALEFVDDSEATQVLSSFFLYIPLWQTASHPLKASSSPLNPPSWGITASRKTSLLFEVWAGSQSWSWVARVTVVEHSLTSPPIPFPLHWPHLPSLRPSGLGPTTPCPGFTHLVSSVQLLSCIQLFATPWIAAHHAPLSITNSLSLLKLMSIELVMPSAISSSVVPFSSHLQSFPASGS